jgi:putrescine aminotransferase
MVIRKDQIDRLINALDAILAKGIPEATIGFIAKNIKGLFT